MHIYILKISLEQKLLNSEVCLLHSKEKLVIQICFELVLVVRFAIGKCS